MELPREPRRNPVSTNRFLFPVTRPTHPPRGNPDKSHKIHKRSYNDLVGGVYIMDSCCIHLTYLPASFGLLRCQKGNRWAAPSLYFNPWWFRHIYKKTPSSTSLAFLRGIHRWPVNSPHKRPVTRKMFPFDDVIMGSRYGWKLYFGMIHFQRRHGAHCVHKTTKVCIRLTHLRLTYLHLFAMDRTFDIPAFTNHTIW